MSKKEKKTTWDELRGHWGRVRLAIEDLRWYIRTQLRFWFFIHIFKKHKIEIFEYADYDPNAKTGWDGKPEYLDVLIKLPGLFRWHHRGIFTVESVTSLLIDKSHEEIHTIVWCHMGRPKGPPLVYNKEQFDEWFSKTIKKY